MTDYSIDMGLSSEVIKLLKLEKDGSYTSECTECHWIVHFKTVKCTFYEFHFN